MTQETETASPAAGINRGDGSDVTITRASGISESSASNRVQGRFRGVRTIGGGHQGRKGRDGCSDRPTYTSSIRNFKIEVGDSGVVLGTMAEQRESKNPYKKFSKNL